MEKNKRRANLSNAKAWKLQIQIAVRPDVRVEPKETSLDVEHARAGWRKTPALDSQGPLKFGRRELQQN